MTIPICSGLLSFPFWLVIFLTGEACSLCLSFSSPSRVSCLCICRDLQHLCDLFDVLLHGSHDAVVLDLDLALPEAVCETEPVLRC